MNTRSDRTENDRKPQTEQKHPVEWEGDLSPNRMAGQNIGEPVGDAEQALPTAYDVKEVHRSLSGDFQDDELKRIPVLPTGQRLQQGATYVDLEDPRRREFTAMGDQSAGEQARLVPKDRVPYSLWNRLTGVDDPDRIAERGDRDSR